MVGVRLEEGVYIIHSDFSGSDWSSGCGSHMSSVCNRLGGSLYETDEMCLGQVDVMFREEV